MKTFNKYLFQANQNILNYNFKKFEVIFLEMLLSGSSLTPLTDEIINIRTDAFQLQSFGRVLRRCGNDKYAVMGDVIRSEAKYCEDAMGRFLYAYEMFCKVAKTNEKLKEGSISDLLVAYFEFTDIFLQIVKKQQLIKEQLSKLPKNHLDLRELYLKGLKKELKKIRRKIKEIDPQLLEDGTHKLRRLIRWVIMHIIYPQGLFTYKTMPSGGPSKFLILKPNSINKPVELTYINLGKLSSLVALLGKSKDALLYHHYEDGLNSKVFDINKSNKATVELTQGILDKINTEKWIKKIRKEL